MKYTLLVDRASMRHRLGRAEQHGGVPIVPAGVHPPWVQRSMGHAGILLNRQRVEVGAQTDGSRRRLRPAAAVQRRDNPGSRQAGMNLEPEGAQLVGDERRGR